MEYKMIHGLRQQKRQLRKEMLRKLSAQPDEVASEKSREVAERLFLHPVWKRAKRIFCFLSMDHEISTEMILKRALESGKRLAVPRMEDEGIVFREITSLEGPFTLHPYGVREPARSLPILAPEEREEDLLVTPGAAFSPSGLRLGYGKAYYDRFFSRYSGAFYSIGICFAFQLLETIPADSSDIAVDEVIKAPV
jgi:5-formyltetrahydrofolate cyclo-ligase